MMTSTVAAHGDNNRPSVVRGRRPSSYESMSAPLTCIHVSAACSNTRFTCGGVNGGNDAGGGGGGVRLYGVRGVGVWHSRQVESLSQSGGNGVAGGGDMGGGGGGGATAWSLGTGGLLFLARVTTTALCGGNGDRKGSGQPRLVPVMKSRSRLGMIGQSCGVVLRLLFFALIPGIPTATLFTESRGLHRLCDRHSPTTTSRKVAKSRITMIRLATPPSCNTPTSCAPANGYDAPLVSADPGKGQEGLEDHTVH